ncbi:DUF4079 domain-containing protein [Oxynema aestuarii]|uniref:DUF4079 domain-containing protein n=1 Tax=Oxynema aestuarii AP17 TaxID=2064643 RepID=A0A6H1TTL2_9CYAN|nr:DUF4079 domain-containing protein [Oxynema aestuarii]QIZ69290.1 DUF4079 domain-containing protein [Oxynema aestuarii AP17]RMH75530.1 MAG: DUF4079 domain-containing protein [Cyanobacteria bacterium J007]
MTIELPAPLQTVLPFFHPLIMWVLFATSVYALFLGIKVKRTRQATGDAKKELIKGKYNIKHYQVGSVLLAFMVFGTIGGMAVTYITNGKLFVGPHLLVGLGMTGLIAASAALAPLMQQGKDWARFGHIGLNMSLLLLFGWQAVTGMQIVQKILSNM